MASETTDDKPARDNAARHVYGPRPLAAVLPALVRPAFRGREAAVVQVLADWAAIVGPVYAAQTVPRRLAAGTLTIGCAGTVAMELQHVAPLLMERINAHLGRTAVSRLRFVQAPPPARAAPAEAPPLAVEAARAAVAPLPPGALRDALERLGRVVLARERR